MSVQELKTDYTMFLDKTTVLYGESGTGKSTLMKDILHMLQPHVHQIIVVSPAEPQNKSYLGIVPNPCIHYEISEQHLKDIYERQDMLSLLCEKAADEKLLKSVYNMIPSGKRAMCDDALQSVERRLRELKESDTANFSKAAAECTKFRLAMLKHVIGQNLRLLYQLPLTTDQKYAIEYMNVNPKMVIIFDDCTEQLAKMKQCQILQTMFYRGRHAKLTILIACHTDKALDAAVKKNTFVSIFTCPLSARAYYNRPSSDFDRSSKNKAFKAIDNVFTDHSKWQKMIIVRGESTFYKYTAETHDDFRFGSESLWKFCDKVKCPEGILSATNKFIHDFQ